jgi:Methyltransferase domain
MVTVKNERRRRYVSITMLFITVGMLLLGMGILLRSFEVSSDDIQLSFFPPSSRELTSTTVTSHGLTSHNDSSTTTSTTKEKSNDIQPLQKRSSSSSIPQQVLDRNHDLMKSARGYLEKGDHPCATSFGRLRRRITCEEDNFKDMITSLPLRDYPHDGHQKEIYHKFVGKYNEVKGMLHPQLAFPSKNDCVVYGMGIHDDSGFEQHMSTFCHHVHAFDCTVETDSPAVQGKSFTFHQTCIGSPTAIDAVQMYGNNNRQLTFKSLSTVMEELGHTHIDLLKFDIEGSEWELFEKEILPLPPSKLPKQILFELHTEKSNPMFVPPKSVKGRGRDEVNRLMLKLFDLGYRIIEQERNDGDPYCTEVSMVRVT